MREEQVSVLVVARAGSGEEYAVRREYLLSRILARPVDVAAMA